MNKKLFLTVISLCILLIIWSRISIGLIETDLAYSWTIRYFVLPISIISAFISYFTYFRTIRQFEKKEYRSLFLTQLRAIFRVITLTAGLTLIFSFTSSSLIVLTNTYFGEQKTIKVQGSVIKTDVSTRKFRTHYFITIKAEQFNRTIDLQVGRPYTIGEPFSQKMKIGYWGLLYSDD